LKQEFTHEKRYRPPSRCDFDDRQRHQRGRLQPLFKHDRTWRPDGQQQRLWFMFGRILQLNSNSQRTARQLGHPQRQHVVFWRLMQRHRNLFRFGRTFGNPVAQLQPLTHAL